MFHCFTYLIFFFLMFMSITYSMVRAQYAVKLSLKTEELKIQIILPMLLAIVLLLSSGTSLLRDELLYYFTFCSNQTSAFTSTKYNEINICFASQFVIWLFVHIKITCNHVIFLTPRLIELRSSRRKVWLDKNGNILFTSNHNVWN